MNKQWIVADWNGSNFFGPFASFEEALHWRDGIQRKDDDETEASIEELLEPELS